MTCKAELLELIRRQCVACCDGSLSEVQACTENTTCYLHPYRFGTDPFNKKRVAHAKKSKKVINQVGTWLIISKIGM
jgi:rRNA maturation protein Nop10